MKKKPVRGRVPQMHKHELCEKIAAILLGDLDKHRAEALSALQAGLYDRRKRDLVELKERL